jgi:ketosteroid isomerase-like protein
MSGRVSAESPAGTFEQFVAAINGHDLETLTSLMTKDHLFVDSLGNHVRGANIMQTGWRSYFTMCPDYWIRIRTSSSEGDNILSTGEAGGTIDGVSWRIPAAWEALIRGGLVSEWRVFADNKPVYEILARRKP